MKWDSELLLEDVEKWASELGRHCSTNAFTEEELSSEGGLGGGQAGLMIVVRERVGVMEREMERGVKQSMGSIGRVRGGGGRGDEVSGGDLGSSWGLGFLWLGSKRGRYYGER